MTISFTIKQIFNKTRAITYTSLADGQKWPTNNFCVSKEIEGVGLLINYNYLGLVVKTQTT